MTRWREALARHHVARRLAPRFDGTALVADLQRIHESWWVRHAGPYHDGAWESVPLWAPNGDLREQRSIGGPFAATPALRFVPYIREVADRFPGVRNRIRLMRLRSGGRILRHSDPMHTVAGNIVRLHVPVVTNPDVRFLVDGRRIPMAAGETWHVDVRFPHEVENLGTTHRVHLVIDLETSTELLALFDGAESFGTGRLTAYFALHALPSRLRRVLGVSGN